MPFSIEKTRMKAKIGDSARNFSVPCYSPHVQDAGSFKNPASAGGKQNGSRGTKRGRGREEDEEDNKDRAPKRQATELDILISHDSVNQMVNDKLGTRLGVPISQSLIAYEEIGEEEKTLADKKIATFAQIAEIQAQIAQLQGQITQLKMEVADTTIVILQGRSI